MAAVVVPIVDRVRAVRALGAGAARRLGPLTCGTARPTTLLGRCATSRTGSYVHNNPRLGQVLTLLVYTPGPWHEIVTPLVELLLFYLLALHALGRKPSFARVDDALVFATIVGMVALTAPLIGQMLFYRPFTGNYLFGFVIALLFFAPYRLHATAPRDRRWWWIPIMLVAGLRDRARQRAHRADVRGRHRVRDRRVLAPR